MIYTLRNARAKLLIIIPAYNEQENIRKTIQDIESHIPEADYIVVNELTISTFR